MPDYANAKFLIYSKFESIPNEQRASTIAGSVLIDCASTIEEAEEKIRVYEGRSASCSVSRGHSSYVCVPNRPEWWY